MSSINVVEVNGDNWASEVVGSDIPVMVDFWAEWCSPCRALGVILNELALEMSGKVKIVSVNVDENMELAKDCDVRSLPTLIMFSDGLKTSDRIIGLTSKVVIKKMMEKYI